MLLLPGRGWRQWRALRPLDLALALAAGAMLALHFWSWNASLGLTTIAASVILVNLQPVIVGALSAALLREAPRPRQWVGILVAVAGAALVVLASTDARAAVGADRPGVGNALAIAGAVTGAVYYLAGRRLRQRLDLWPYVALVYGTCLLVLLGFAFVLSVPLVPQPRREVAIFAALAIGPMMLGHTGMNWALRHLPAYVVNLTTLGEPVGAILLAAALPGIREIPDATTVVGGAVVLAGILLALPRTGGAG